MSSNGEEQGSDWRTEMRPNWKPKIGAALLVAASALPISAQHYDHQNFYNGARDGGRGGSYNGRDHGYDRDYHPGGIGPGKGAAIGAAGGAALGAIFGGGLKGALIGGAAGAGVGAIAGKEHQDNQRRDYYYGGRRY
jgi:hypothetical protein